MVDRQGSADRDCGRGRASRRPDYPAEPRHDRARRPGGASPRPQTGGSTSGQRPGRTAAEPHRRAAGERPGPAVVAAGVAARHAGVAECCQSHRSARPARLCTRCRPRPIDRRPGSRTPVPAVRPGGQRGTGVPAVGLRAEPAPRDAGGGHARPRDPARRRRDRHVRQACRLAVHAGTTRSGTPLPGNDAGCRPAHAVVRPNH